MVNIIRWSAALVVLGLGAAHAQTPFSLVGPSGGASEPVSVGQVNQTGALKIDQTNGAAKNLTVNGGSFTNVQMVTPTIQQPSIQNGTIASAVDQSTVGGALLSTIIGQALAKNVANGVAGLDATGHVPATLLGDLSSAKYGSGTLSSAIQAAVSGGSPSLLLAYRDLPNGVAGLDANGNVTQPVITSSVTAGHVSVPVSALSAVPGTLGSSYDIAATLGSIPAHDKTVYTGAIAGAYQFATPSNSANLRGTGRAGLMMTTLGLSHVIANDATTQFQGSPATAQGVINAFAGTGPGIIEGNLDSATTPDVPSADWNYGRTDTWETWNSQIGWQPSIFLMNMNNHGTPSTTQYTTTDVQDVVTGTNDIKNEAPYVKLVLPYLSANAGVYGSWANDAYWSTARNLALEQGGFAIDVPAGLYLENSPAYQQVVKDQITWAIQNHLVVIMLLSPYSTNPADCTEYPISGGTCQFAPDPHFMTSVQEVVRQLHNDGADPTIWVVDNYSETAVSPEPGTDDKSSSSYSPNTILAVASWIADNAPTSPYPTAMLGVESPGSLITAPQVQNGNPTATPTLGSLRGAGSMAYENSDAVSILGGTITGNIVAQTLQFNGSFTSNLIMGPHASIIWQDTTGVNDAYASDYSDGTLYVGSTKNPGLAGITTNKINASGSLNVTGAATVGSLITNGNIKYAAGKSAIFSDLSGNSGAYASDYSDGTLYVGNATYTADSGVTTGIGNFSGAVTAATVAESGTGSANAGQTLSAWNCSLGQGEACIVNQGSIANGATQGFSVYQETTANALSSATKIFSVDKSGNVAVPGNVNIGDGKSFAFGGSSCYAFHDDAKAGIVIECGTNRIVRFPDNGSAPVYAVSPVVGTP